MNNNVRNFKKLFYAGFFLVSLGVLVFSAASSTATGTSTATAAITDYVAFTLNANLTTAGINFGGNLSINTIHNNATNNSHTLGSSDAAGTGYSVQISSDTNTNGVTLCANGTSTFASGGNNFAIAYLAYAVSSAANTVPNSSATNMSTTLTAVGNGTALTASDRRYFNFWLTIPAGQSAGTYTGTIYIRATSSGGACT